MSPPNEGWIEARPCGRLIRHVAHDAHCAVLTDCHLLNSREDAIREDDFSANVFACVVLIGGAIADVDQSGFDICAATVVGEVDGIRLPVPD